MDSSLAGRFVFALASVWASAIGPAAAPAEAQIVNTLRRWSEAEPGWDGDVEARFAVASGNTVEPTDVRFSTGFVFDF